MENKTFSIKYRVLSYMYVVLLPLTIIISGFAVYQVKENQERLESSEKMNLHLITKLAEEETQQLERFLYDLALNNYIFRSMAEIQKDSQLYSTSYDVYAAYEHLFETYKDLSFLILYSNENEYYTSRDNGLEYLSVTESNELREAVEKRFIRYFMENNSTQKKWYTVIIKGRPFLCRVVFNQDLYCVAAIDLERMIYNLEKQNNLDNSLIFRDGEQLLTTFSINENENIDGTAVGEEIIGFTELIESNQLNAVNQAFNGITLTYFWPGEGIIGAMGWPSILLFFITLVSIITLPLLYFSLRKNFFLPLDSLVETMTHISQGNQEATADERYTCKEFRLVNKTFNEMISQITNLRIEQYEKELETRQAKLQFLQAQIRPHFYLNCLKTIHSLAIQRHYEDIEKSILLLSNHLRYAFQQNDETVPLRDEIRLCDNYVKLFNVLSEKSLKHVIDVDNDMFDVRIPPVSLLTFVENSIRYGVIPEKNLKIIISVRKLLMEEGDILCITIRDNGPGFSNQQLKWLNSTTCIESEIEHVGIQNVIRRFRIIYGDAFAIAFANRDGAVQELYLPINRAQGGQGIETIDC